MLFNTSFWDFYSCVNCSTSMKGFKEDVEYFCYTVLYFLNNTFSFYKL